VTTAIGSNGHVGNSGTGYVAANAAGKAATTGAQDSATGGQGSTPAPSSGDSVTLSDAAKAYLAANAATDTPTDSATVAANARAWFDQQYKTLGISSAMLDGQVAVDMTSLSRATLSAVASNSQGLFTQDESAAAATTLQTRFNDAMMPHVVIARNTGDYASLYQAASDYLDQAGADEKATASWQDQKQAVLKGLTAASQAFGKAPDTGDANDPIGALLDATSQTTPATDADNASDPAANARAMLDAQANKARDEGSELVFNSGRKTGVQVDFTNFDNQSLAVVSLNQDGLFSPEEAYAAKQALDQRDRASILSAFDSANGSGTVQDASLALLQQYSSMSDAEKTALGYGSDFTDRIIQSYRTVSMLQNALGTAPAPSMTSYL